MGHARSKAVVPTKVRRRPARHQLLENSLLVAGPAAALRAYALRSPANQWPIRLQRHGAKVLLNPLKERAVRKPPFSKVESLLNYLTIIFLVKRMPSATSVYV